MCTCLAVQVNDEDLRYVTHEHAIQVLRQTPAVVRMLVFRDETLLKDDDIYDVFSVELMKKPNKGLGISIVGRRNASGVFISDIVSPPSPPPSSTRCCRQLLRGVLYVSFISHVGCAAVATCLCVVTFAVRRYVASPVTAR